MRPGGVFYASYKAGSDEGRDGFGRHYNYPCANWLRQAYGESGWERVELEEAAGGGYDGRPTTWLHVTATKATSTKVT